MKTIVLLSYLYLFPIFLFSQNNNFEIFENGLIYDTNTIGRLTSIADSLNSKFIYQKQEKKYYSNYQGKGSYIKIRRKNLAPIVNDIKENLSFQDIRKKAPFSYVKENIFIVQSNKIGYQGDVNIDFSEINTQFETGHSFFLKEEEYRNRKRINSNWIYKIYEFSNSDIKELHAFYFPQGLHRKELDEKYSKMIEYSDYIIGPTKIQRKFNSAIFKSWSELLKLRDAMIELPQNWRSLSIKEKEILLEKMNNSQVITLCGQDRATRIHELSKALLAADISNWSIFLRSHLNMMNDRFVREIDAAAPHSYRKTYIAELEHLHIKTIDLLLGITLRASNHSENHFLGNIYLDNFGTKYKTSKVMLESKYRDILEAEILQIISDENLDDFNRVIGYFLYKNYINQIENNRIQKKKNNKLEVALMSLPEYLRNNTTKKHLFSKQYKH